MLWQMHTRLKPETLSLVFAGRGRTSMSIALEVGLLSGKTVTVTADLEEDIGTLKFRAQTALGVGNGRLVDSSRNVLDAGARIKDARVQKGDALTLHISQVQVQASKLAFAAILGDGSVVTWGAAFCGGVSSSVQEQLKNVEKIQASGYAFAAIRGDGSVVTWGMAVRGGDSSAVQDHLKQVRQIHASEGAFADVRCDGSVVTWGHVETGGCSSAVKDQLNSVQQIQANGCAFAAILGNGSVATWGVMLTMEVTVALSCTR